MVLMYCHYCNTFIQYSLETEMSGRRLRKVTYSLPEDLIDRVRWAVQAGAAPSYSAFVEQALSELVHRARERELAGAFRAAGADPDFLADVGCTLERFESGDVPPENGKP